jgi:hypothetical protein
VFELARPLVQQVRLIDDDAASVELEISEPLERVQNFD